MRRLEIGPGDCPLEGDWDLGEWDLLDAKAPPGIGLDYVARWGYEALPIADDSYDLVFSSHVIEHIPWYYTIDALKEIHRILKQGGTFEVWTVNFLVVVQSYMRKQQVGDGWDCGGRIEHWMQSIAGRIFAYEKDGNEYNWHKAIFDRPYLKECLYKAGFPITGDLTETRGHDHGIINMGVWARK